MREHIQTISASSPQPIDSTIGLDLGDRWSRYCVLGRKGEVVKEDRVVTSRAALEQRFRQVPATRIVMEAGTHSPWVSRLLESQGHEVIVANARKVRLIYESNPGRLPAA